MGEQIIAAELHRDPDGTVNGITFQGQMYARLLRPADVDDAAFMEKYDDPALADNEMRAYLINRTWARRRAEHRALKRAFRDAR